MACVESQVSELRSTSTRDVGSAKKTIADLEGRLADVKEKAARAAKWV
jgi:hypothetical protein